MSRARNSRAGLALAAASAFAFGGSGVAAKPLIESGVDPLHVVWLRVAGAALVMLPLALHHRSAVRRRPGLLLGFGLLAVAGVQGFYFASISYIPVGVALLVEYLAPALVLVWVRFVQRKPVTKAAAVGVLLAVGGLAGVVQVWSGLAFDPLGLLLALGAAACQVAYFLLSEKGSEGDASVSPVAIISYGLLIGAAVLTVVARPWQLDWSQLSGQAVLGGQEVPEAALVGWIVLVSTVIAFLTGVVAVRRLSPQVAGVVACLEAVIATVLAWALLDERLAAPQIVGGLMVLTGAFIAQSATPSATDRPAQRRDTESAGTRPESEPALQRVG
ncbi:EamA family transporter [Streptomyces sp. B-S-A8]|uniref:EamA family transporter n=1 Tax=Streptomyces solicavernae TaxID=3043614 RepID=A0ABT6S066_9ACTN|nr:EamA family transporter [Streptomyces sp. B-S-A8]MDI3389970.1 EamA family transporter [Streptomyces sp. B-S-A8]